MKMVPCPYCGKSTITMARGHKTSVCAGCASFVNRAAAKRERMALNSPRTGPKPWKEVDCVHCGKRTVTTSINRTAPISCVACRESRNLEKKKQTRKTRADRKYERRAWMDLP